MSQPKRWADSLVRSLGGRTDPRPVVRATLSCRYCAHTFKQEFTAEDDLSEERMDVRGPIMRWLPGANVKRIHVSRVRHMLFWTREVREERRAMVSCPNCGRGQCAITKRDPIPPKSTPSTWTPPRQFGAGDSYTTRPVSFSGTATTRGI